MAKLNTCYTQAEVELVFQELPFGMEALYDRMAEVILAREPTQRAFIQKILNVVSCALQTLTIAELSAIVDDKDILDLEKMVVELCSGFVIVDNSGNVSLTHQTAREYLFENTGLHKFTVNQQLANKDLFLSCMGSLTTASLRSKISQKRIPESFAYAACRWSSHLIQMSHDCDECSAALSKFLTGSWVLIWIYYLSSRESLNMLVRSAKHLARFVTRCRQNASRNMTHAQIQNLEVFASWAVDFVKLAGKFGRSLRRNPESIFKIVPSLCPQSSSIFQQFGKQESRSLSLSGFADSHWDDSLGRFSFVSDSYASFLHAAGSYIFVLLPSGSIIVYDTSTFDQQAFSPFKHGEWIDRMQTNSTGTMLVSYGYRTTKIFSVATGKCTHTVPHVEVGPRPLLLHLKANILVVGLDEDKSLYSLNLDQNQPAWDLVAELEEPEELPGKQSRLMAFVV